MNKPTLRIATLAAVAAGALALSACMPVVHHSATAKPATTGKAVPSASASRASSDPSASSGTGSTSSGDGQTVSGPGYSFEVPADWKPITPPPAQTDVAYVTTNPQDGFAENVVANHTSATGIADVDAIAEAAKKQFEAAGLTCDLAYPAPLDTESSSGLSCENQAQGYRQLQAYAIHGSTAYFVTYSAPLSMDETDAEMNLDDVLYTWQWTS